MEKTQIAENRLARLLREDKAEMNEATHTAALKAFKKVAEEFFEVDGGYVLTTRKNGPRTEAVLTFPVSRVKNFTQLKG